ncbi:MAG: hypothetical protein ACYDER_01390 [Ktedonobacteraceae bacterium]
MERIFPTFCHVSDYGEFGHGLLPQMIESSYPLILWAPPGKRVNDYYDRGICPIPPKKLIHYVEEGFVQIIGREDWLLDEGYRKVYAKDKPFATWCDNFDGAIKRIWLDQQSIQDEYKRSVLIAPKEDGWDWAKNQLEAEPERIDNLWERIKKKQVPPVSLKRIQESGYGEKDKYQAALQVLRDARNHTKAIEDANVEMPFLLEERDGKFFRYLERSGRAKPLQIKRTSSRGISLEFSQEVDRLLDRLKRPEKVSSLDEFIGSEAHKDLAKWLLTTVHLAQLDWSKHELRKFLVGELKRDIKAALPTEKGGNLLGAGVTEKAVTVSGLITGIASLFFSGLVFDPATAITLTGLTMNVVPIVSGISQRLGIIKPDYRGPQWPYLFRFNRTPTKYDINEVKAILDTLYAELNE